MGHYQEQGAAHGDPVYMSSGLHLANDIPDVTRDGCGDGMARKKPFESREMASMVVVKSRLSLSSFGSASLTSMIPGRIRGRTLNSQY